MTHLGFEDILILTNKSPLHLHYKRYENGILEKSQYEIEQDAVKRAILSTNAFYGKYSTEKTYNKKQADKAKDDHSKLTGKVFLHEDAYKNALGIASEYSKNGVLDRFLSGAEKLKKVNFEIEGVPCVSEIDIFNPVENVIAFIKVTKNAGEAFEREIFTQNHHLEMAFAAEAVRQAYRQTAICYIVAIEKTKPYVCGLHKLLPENLELGMNIVKKAIELFKFSENPENRYRPYFGGHARQVTTPNWLYS